MLKKKTSIGLIRIPPPGRIIARPCNFVVFKGFISIFHVCVHVILIINLVLGMETFLKKDLLTYALEVGGLAFFGLRSETPASLDFSKVAEQIGN